MFKPSDSGPKPEQEAPKAQPRLFKASPSPQKPVEEEKPVVSAPPQPPTPVSVPPPSISISPTPVPAPVVEPPHEPVQDEGPRKVSVPPPKLSLPKISSRVTKAPEPEEKMEIEKAAEAVEDGEEKVEDGTLEAAKRVKQKIAETKKKNVEAAKSFRKSRSTSLTILADRLKDSDRMKKSFNAAFLADTIDVRQMWYKSIVSGIIASIMLLLFSYFFYAFKLGSFFDRTFIFTYYSQGKPINEIIGLWAVTYTPISSFSVLNPDWIDDWVRYLGPTILSAVIIGGMTKNVRYALLGCFFFGFAGIMFTFTFMSILPLFGIVDTATIDAGIIAAFPNVIDSFNGFYTWVLRTTNSVYFGWSFAGSLELALFSIIVAVPASIVASILNSLFEKEVVVVR